MPSSLLYAVNNEGRVFGLSTNGTKWREFIYLGLEFKQLSAVRNFLWALGSDRQVYVHAHGLDVPIRVKEETYENERWTPFDGFSKRLLPTDRYNFSNENGTVDRSFKKIKLPSMAWQWEGDWKLELTLDGQPLEADGWTYAVDFPASYYPVKQWSSCVRRRKWVRYRKYMALNSWCAIAPLHKDPIKEPFIYVAVGGTQLPSQSDGSMLVWAVTAYGRVMFRAGVSRICPEGQKWSSVTMPFGCEVSQVAVGSTGLVWVILWNGKALVRTGITRECFTGSDWVEVEQPESKLSLQQISIGYCSLWAITRDARVWFRKGIDGGSSGTNQFMATGTSWIEMYGSMSSISVAPNDQVWAVGAENKILYFRTSVTQEDLMGKTWRALKASAQLSRTSSSATLLFNNGYDGNLKEKRHRSWASLSQSTVNQETESPKSELDLWKTCHSAPEVASKYSWQSSPDSCAQNFTSGLTLSSTKDHANEIGVPKNVETCNLPTTTSAEIEEFYEKNIRDNSIAFENISRPVYALITKDIAMPTRSWSPQYAGGSVVAAEAHYAADSIVFESDELAGIYSEHGEREEEDDDLYWTDSEAFWTSVEAGACIVNNSHLPDWFSINVTKKTKEELDEPWRINILKDLRKRPSNAFEGLDGYEKAIDSSAWKKIGRCKCLLPTQVRFHDCFIELEWSACKENGVESGILVLFNENRKLSLAEINMKNVTAVINCSVPRHPRIALYSGSTSYCLKLQFESEDDFEEWKSEFSTVCCRLRNITRNPSSQSIWMTTMNGNILACDLFQTGIDQQTLSSEECSLEQTFAERDMPIEIPLRNSFSPGSFILMWGRIPRKAKKFTIDLVCKKETQVSDIAYHFNSRFDEERVVQNSRIGLDWGAEESLVLPFEAGSEFRLKISRESHCIFARINDVNVFKFHLKKTDSDEENSIFDCITHLSCFGDVTITKIRYSSNEIIMKPTSLFWRPIEGHLRKVETADGITWGIGFDNTAWLYAGIEVADDTGYRMHDTRYYYVYENQRWNPLTGYTSHGLPTDRFMWSDDTGKLKKTRESTVLPCKKWRWVNDWNIDFCTPGGVDSQGWQYAVDFPSSYHGTKTLTDCVRRRRWYRCAKLECWGPWTELGYTPILECSLHSNGNFVTAWAVATNGSVLYRKGVSKMTPGGLSWEHVAADEKMISISCGANRVWAVSKNGMAFCRIGISETNPIGTGWEMVGAPEGTLIKQVTVGENGIWILDICGRVSLRCNVSGAFPMGSHWRIIPSISQDQQNAKDQLVLSDFCSSDSIGQFRQISTKKNLWGVTNSGCLAHRLGVQSSNPVGLLWDVWLEANILHLSGL